MPRSSISSQGWRIRGQLASAGEGMVNRPRMVTRPRIAERRSRGLEAAQLPERIDHSWPSTPATRAEPPVEASLTPSACSDISEPNPVRLAAGMRKLQLENVHPLRLRLLLEIERTGSISSAAEACAIAQPSASMHVRTLELATGQRLVDRNGRGSRLTPAGKIVASHAERVLAALESMRLTLDELDGRSVGEFSLAASLTPSLVLLPSLLLAYAARCPGASISLRTNP